MKRNKKKLNEAEWEIMEGIWQFDRPVTVREIHQLLYPNGEKAYTTVQTFMNILTEKGFLKRKKSGMVNFYTPALNKEEAAALETRKLVSRLFSGSFSAFANYLINSGELSQEDLKQLKSLIEQKEKNA